LGRPDGQVVIAWKAFPFSVLLSGKHRDTVLVHALVVGLVSCPVGVGQGGGG